MTLKPTRIWIKLSIAFVVMIIVIMSLVTYTFTLRQITAERNELRNSMGSIARMIASVRFVETEGWYVYQDWIDNLIKSDASRQIIYIAVFDENHNLVARTLNSRHLDLGITTYVTPAEQDEIVERLVRGQVAEESQRDFDHILVDISEANQYLGQVDVGFSLVDFNTRVWNRLMTNLGLFVLFFVLAIAGSIFLGRRIARPLSHLSQAMRSVSAGRLGRTLEISSRDEIADLARSFNYMTTRLRERQVIENFARKLAFTTDFHQLQKLIIEEISHAMGASEAALVIKEKSKGERWRANIWKHPNHLRLFSSLEMDNACCTRIIDHHLPLIKNQFDRINGLPLLMQRLAHIFDIRSVELISPFKNNSESIGMVLVTNKLDGLPYDKDEQQFLHTLTSQATFAIEHVQVLEDLNRKKHFERELEIARNVQKRLLPEFPPNVPGAQISGICLPAFEVGGDYFDYFVLDEYRVGIAVADVSGKGTSAAFYMAEMKGMMSSLAPVIDSPKQLLSIVNQRLYKNVDRKVFATMIYGIWNSKTKEFLFVRAGHNALILKRADHEVELLIPQGLGLGLANGEFFKKYSDEIKMKMESGDTLLLYTDGISEARNADREEFGEDRLCEVLHTINSATPGEIQNNILMNVKNFTQNEAQHDDITMVLLKVD